MATKNGKKRKKTFLASFRANIVLVDRFSFDFFCFLFISFYMLKISSNEEMKKQRSQQPTNQQWNQTQRRTVRAFLMIGHNYHHHQNGEINKIICVYGGGIFSFLFFSGYLGIRNDHLVIWKNFSGKINIGGCVIIIHLLSIDLCKLKIFAKRQT